MLPTYEIIARLLLGTLLGGIIGFERQSHGRPAGFRTQLLVCVACTLLMLISEHYQALGTADPGYIRFDPTRIAAGAMTGVGFLGAGVILKTGMSIQGLTTAACIWIVSAIGLAVGAGNYVAALTGFVITVFSLWILRTFEGRIPQLAYRHVKLVTDDRGDVDPISSLFTGMGFTVSRMDCDADFVSGEKIFYITLTTKRHVKASDLISSVHQLGFVKKMDIRS